MILQRFFTGCPCQAGVRTWGHAVFDDSYHSARFEGWLVDVDNVVQMATEGGNGGFGGGRNF
jgi:hypothetical protein